MAPTQALGLFVSSAHPAYLAWIQALLQRSDVDVRDTLDDDVAHVLIDAPFGWTLHRLAQLDGTTRSRTLIVTARTHPAYLDCLASHHVSGVATVTEPHDIVAGAYAAASSKRTYHYRSNLTFMELRVLRLLLQGVDTLTAANRLDVSYKTINAHVSNALGKLGVEGRAQMIVHLLGGTEASWKALEAREAIHPLVPPVTRRNAASPSPLPHAA